MASPSNEANQAIHNLRGQWSQDALYKVGLLVRMLKDGRDTYPEEKIAEKLDFKSVEGMRAQLERWGVSGLVPPGDAAASPKDAPHKKPLKPLKGESEELPPAADAADLFEHGLRALKSNLRWTRNHRQVRTGRVFEALGDYPGEDEPRRRGFWLHPHPWEVHLIVAYLLNYYTAEDIDALLQRLHPRYADPATRQETLSALAKLLYGDPKKPNRGQGLFGEMRRVASVVRGVPVDENGKFKSGRPRSIPEGPREHTIVREVAAMRQEGYSYKDIIEDLREHRGLEEAEAKRLLNFRPEGW